MAVQCFVNKQPFLSVRLPESPPLTMSQLKGCVAFSSDGALRWSVLTLRRLAGLCRYTQQRTLSRELTNRVSPSIPEERRVNKVLLSCLHLKHHPTVVLDGAIIARVFLFVLFSCPLSQYQQALLLSRLFTFRVSHLSYCLSQLSSC